MSFQRKLKKLIRNPKLFFKDMYFKKSTQLKQQIPIKYQGKHSFTIVTAVYNVEKYLDEFFHSIITQSLNFKEHIQIICVDDGSKDHSADIIKKYKKKYPNNIYYYYKENGGQASARNLGLQYVKTEWVTFIDPDDFISNDYFHKIDLFLSKQVNISLICCPLILYFEDKKIFKDTHPLKYRFAKGNSIFPINDLSNQLQLSASTAIFKLDYIIKNKIFFDEKMKPSFEDAKFVTDYILRVDNEEDKVGFISDISYFYRKRSDGSSTLDGAWKNPLLFTRVLEKGCIAILDEAKNKFGYVPKHIQRIALYHIIWYFGRIINNPSSLSHLTEAQKKTFSNLVFKIFSYIDEKTILEFNLAGVWFFQKVALLGLFKNAKPNTQIAYVEKYDLAKDQILISYFSNFSLLEKWCLDDNDIIPTHQKTVKYTFLNHLYTREYRTWISCKGYSKFEFYLDNKQVNLTLAGKQYKSLSISEIKKHFKQQSTIQNNDWIFMDRDNQADDNAEHLYRYISKKYPDQPIYFALNKSSHDWQRLNNEGFNLLEFGSIKFENKLKNSAKIISSHIDGYITHYFKDNSLLDKDYIFLQHGVTKDDLSLWLNTKKIACFITVTNPEYKSISDNDSPYKFGNKEVKLTGFPRYDKLIENNNTENYQILIMPTWRSNIVGTYINGTTRERNPNFMNTNYAKHWHSFVNNKHLKTLHNKGYKIIFAPHPSIQEYMNEFTVPKYIDIYSYSNGNIQQLFQNSDLLITDYSSVAFDMAYLNKSIIYYQFDYIDVFSGNHTYSKGYFEYEKDGFGAVVYNEQDLFNELEISLKNNGKPIEPYKSRIKNTFPFRDGNNCERVYQAIKSLDLPEMPAINTEILLNKIKQADQHQAWDLLIKRSKLMISLETSHTEFAQEMLIKGLFNTHCFIELEQELDKFDNVELTLHWQAKLAFVRQDWTAAISYLEKLAILSLDIQFMKLRCYIELGYLHNAQKVILALKKQSLSSIEDKLLQLYQEFLTLSDINAVLHQFENSFTEGYEDSLKELQQYQPELLLARLYRKARLYDKTHQQLVNFEKHTKNNISCRIEIALLAFSRKNYDKVISQLEKCFGENIQYLSEPCMKAYFTALDKTKQNDKINRLLNTALQAFPNNLFLLEKRIEIGINSKNSQLVLQTMQDLFKAHHYIPTENFSLLIKHRIIHKFTDLVKALAENETKSYLLGKVAMVCGNWKFAEQQLTLCQLSNTKDLLSIIKIYAECQKEYSHTLHFNQLMEKELSNGEKNLLESYLYLKARNWRNLIKTLELSLFTEQEIIHYKPNLLLSRAFRKLGEYQQAHKHLVQYEKKNHGDLMLRTAIARLAFANQNYEKCVAQFQTAFDTQTSAFSENSAAEFSLSLVKTSKFDILKSVLPIFIMRFPNNELLNLSAIYLAIEQKKWKEVLTLSRSFGNKNNNDLLYPIILANIRLGKIEIAYQHHIRPTHEHSYDFWNLIAELAILMEDWDLAKYCYKGMLSIYPEQNREQNLTRLLQLANY